MPALSHNNASPVEEFAAKISHKISNGDVITDEDLQALDALFLSGDVSKLPVLDRSFLQQSNKMHPQLVRHIGMVQDSLDPEYYVSQVEGFGSTHFRDLPPSVSLSEEELSLGNQLAERQPVLLVPLPFTTDWFEQCLDARNSNPPDSKSMATDIITPLVENRKREREPLQEREGAARSGNSKPRTLESESVNSLGNGDENTRAQALTNSKPGVEWWPIGCSGSSKQHCPVLGKFYYDQGTDKKRGKLRLNEIVETIGILSMNPWEADFSSSEDEMFFGTLAPPPPSQLIRMHVLSYQPVELDQISLGVFTSDKVNSEVAFGSNEAIVPDLLNRSLAAQSLFLALVSKAERKRMSDFGEEQFTMQRTSSSTVGCISLELITTANDSKTLFRTLEASLSNHCPIVATIDFSSSSPGFPSKVNGRIIPTPWQLPKGSTLLIHFASSESEKNGSLEEFLMFNRIPYQFDGGLKIPFDADYRIIVVSDKPSGKCTLSVNCDVSNITEWFDEISNLCLSLKQCRKIGNIKLSQEVLEKAQQDFLAQRALARSNRNKRMPQEEDFHRLLTLTRLQARSRQSHSANIQDWDRALELDDAIYYSK